MKDTKTNLGGFPPIYYINNETKKKREFEKKATENIDTSTYKNLNILKIPSITIKKILNESSESED